MHMQLHDFLDPSPVVWWRTRIHGEKVPVTTWQLITELSSRQHKKKVIADDKIGDMKISSASEIAEAFTCKN